MLGRLASSIQSGFGASAALGTAARNLTTYPSDLKQAFAEQIPAQQVGRCFSAIDMMKLEKESFK